MVLTKAQKSQAAAMQSRLQIEIQAKQKEIQDCQVVLQKLAILQQEEVKDVLTDEDS